MRRVICVFSAALAIAATLVGTTVALTGYDYYVSVDIENTGATDITARIQIPINASALISGGFMQNDADDVRLTSGGTQEDFTAGNLAHTAAKWLTNWITIPAGTVVRRNLWMGNDTATRGQEWIADAADTVTVTDAASLDVTGNLTIAADVNIATIPSGDTYILNKSGAYWLKVGANDTLTAGIHVAGNITFYSSTSDGEIWGISGVSAVAARDAATGTLKDAVATAWVGQHFGAGNYYTNRAFLFFDTSGLPDNTVVTSAAVKLWGYADSSDTDFNIQVQDGTPTYPHDPMVVGDYDKTHYSGNGGSSLSTNLWILAGYNAIPLNATGRGWIDMTGTTKLTLRSSRDINAIDQTGPEFVEFYTTERVGTSTDPTLTLTYYADIEVSATIAEDTDYSVKATYDGSDLKLYVDSVEQDSEAYVGNITTTANNMAILDFDGRIDDLKLGNTSVAAPTWNLNLQFEPSQISTNTISDQSAGSNDATYALGANPANISVTVYELRATDLAEASYTSDDMAAGLSPGIPDQPTNWYGTVGDTEDWGNLPGVGIAEEFLTGGEVPLAFFWLAVITLSLLIAGYAVYAAGKGSKSLLAVGIVQVVLLVFFGATMPAFGFWVLAPHIIVALAVIIADRQYGF